MVGTTFYLGSVDMKRKGEDILFLNLWNQVQAHGGEVDCIVFE